MLWGSRCELGHSGFGKCSSAWYNLSTRAKNSRFPEKDRPSGWPSAADRARWAAILALVNIDDYSHVSSFGRSSLMTPRATP